MGQCAGHCHLSNAMLEWLNGELLGDGHLCSFTCSARFQYSSKYLEYINYVSDTLAQFGIIQSGKIQRRVTSVISYNYKSRSYTDLFDVWAAWYMYGNKQIPKDLELTPIVCRQWYIGDGCLKKSTAGTPYIVIGTCGFPVWDVLWLVTELRHLGFITTYYPSSNYLSISTSSTKDFLNYIGKCPVECYKYKWGC